MLPFSDNTNYLSAVYLRSQHKRSVGPLRNLLFVQGRETSEYLRGTSEGHIKQAC